MTDPYYQDATVTLFHGDCLNILTELPDQSVDSVVTDPPAAISFMNKSWDGDRGGRKQWVDWMTTVMAECCRILKPGGHAFVWALPRTSHWTAWAIEDAGLIIRDCVVHLFGSGFPKSLDIGKAVDRAAGEVAGKQWQGWGTSLKPGSEHWWLARKPLQGTVANNTLRWGVGGLNIDATRIEHTTVNGGNLADNPHLRGATHRAKSIGGDGIYHGANPSVGAHTSQSGRWPANVTLDPTQAHILDKQSGEAGGGFGVRGASTEIYGGGKGFTEATGEIVGYGDSGGASRFFYTAVDDLPARFMYTAKAGGEERPFAWKPSCNCETIKPCEETSPPPDTADSRSAHGKSWNTSSSGNNTTDDPSPSDTTSTTSTATNSTTTSPTFNSSPSSNTNESTPDASSVTANGGSPAPSATNSSPSPLSTGISAPKAGPSTGDAVPAISDAWLEKNVCGRCGAPWKVDRHATVKPLSLMRWLAKLVTPPGGTILEPFAGSGTTIEAAIIERFRIIAVEREADYLPLCMSRIHRRRDPIAALSLQAEDLGLFADDGEPA